MRATLILLSICLVWVATLGDNGIAKEQHKQSKDKEVDLEKLEEYAGTVQGQYIVGLADRKIYTDEALEGLENTLKDSYQGKVIQRLRAGNFHAFHVHTDNDNLLLQARSLPEVEFIERNKVTHTDHTLETQDNERATPENGCTAHPSIYELWGLKRISQRGRLIINDTKKFNYYSSSENDGSGVTAYVLDTGIRLSHEQFQGRAYWGYTSSMLLASNHTEEIDGGGHGTHCAGTIGGATTGVAKNVSLVAVKVLSDKGSGSTVDFIQGIGWMIGHYQRLQNAQGNKAKAVASMSLGYNGTAYAADRALMEGSLAGIIMVNSAGNKHGDSCYFSMPRGTYGISVAASDYLDQLAYFSNWGPCVDIIAPGRYIYSAGHQTDTSYNKKSGTSMACPHVAGAVARYLSTRQAAPTQAQVSSWLLHTATVDAIRFRSEDTTDPDHPVVEESTANRLLYVNCAELTAEEPVAPPSAPGTCPPNTA